MRQPAWPLLRDGGVDVFKPFPFATDPRMNVVNAELMFRNWLGRWPTRLGQDVRPAAEGARCGTRRSG